MKLPKNTAADDLSTDNGMLSESQVQERINKETEMWKRVALCKTPLAYKKLVEENIEFDGLLSLLDINSPRTSVPVSIRLSPSNYFKLQKLMKLFDMSDARDYLEDLVEKEYEKQFCKTKK